MAFINERSTIRHPTFEHTLLSHHRLPGEHEVQKLNCFPRLKSKGVQVQRHSSAQTPGERKGGIDIPTVIAVDVNPLFEQWVGPVDRDPQQGADLHLTLNRPHWHRQRTPPAGAHGAFSRGAQVRGHETNLSALKRTGTIQRMLLDHTECFWTPPQRCSRPHARSL